MKKICNFLKNFLIIAYILLIIFVTICLLSYNDYKMAVLGKNTLIPIIDEDLEPDYIIGDLLIVNKNKLSSVEIGDVIFFYRTAAGETTINYATVTNTERVTDTEFTYTVEGDLMFSSDKFIGKAETATVVPGVGRFLSILLSKWGFLFLGVFPSLIAFLYTLYSVILEVKDDDDDEIEKESDEKKKKKKSSEPKKKIEKKEEDKAVKNKSVEEKPKVATNTKVEEKTQVTPKTEAKTQTTSKANAQPQKQTAKSETKPVQNNNTNKTQTDEQKKKALIEAKMKSMTEEEKKALIQAKLNSMTDEQKRALIEAKKKKMEAEKNKK